MGESQKHYVEEGSVTQKVYTVWFHLCDILEQAKQITVEKYTRTELTPGTWIGWERSWGKFLEYSV